MEKKYKIILQMDEKYKMSVHYVEKMENWTSGFAEYNI